MQILALLILTLVLKDPYWAWFHTVFVPWVLYIFVLTTPSEKISFGRSTMAFLQMYLMGKADNKERPIPEFSYVIFQTMLVINLYTFKKGHIMEGFALWVWILFAEIARRRLLSKY